MIPISEPNPGRLNWSHVKSHVLEIVLLVHGLTGLSVPKPAAKSILSTGQERLFFRHWVVVDSVRTWLNLSVALLLPVFDG